MPNRGEPNVFEASRVVIWLPIDARVSSEITDVIFFEVEVMTSVSLFRGFFFDTCQRIFDRSEACWSFMSVNSFIIDVQYSSLPGLKQGMAADGAHYAVELD
jgi:hypothetical protein